ASHGCTISHSPLKTSTTVSQAFFHSSKIPFPPLCPSFPFAGIMKSYEQRLSTNVDVFFQFN
ncbi:MAG TPA: hypothetical protein PK637_06575, partial [Flavobacteriales bacterium]|nr:hypothetical protein [Flavobacteriales bacterium]